MTEETESGRDEVEINVGSNRDVSTQVRQRKSLRLQQKEEKRLLQERKQKADLDLENDDGLGLPGEDAL